MAGKEAALVRAPDTNKFILAQSGRTFLCAHPERKIWRGSVAALRADKRSFIEYHNADPRPLRRTKSADQILSSIERFCAYNSPAANAPRTRLRDCLSTVLCPQTTELRISPTNL
jgi:hypothetical protein